jgi:hypothetical protein
MEGRHEGLEPLERAYYLSSLSGEVEAVGRGDRSMHSALPTGNVARSAAYALTLAGAVDRARSTAVPLQLTGRWGLQQTRSNN